MTHFIQINPENVTSGFDGLMCLTSIYASTKKIQYLVIHHIEKALMGDCLEIFAKIFQDDAISPERNQVSLPRKDQPTFV